MSERPDLIWRYATTEDAYYAHHQDHNTFDGFRQGPSRAPYVCDRYGRWDCIPCRDGEASELLSRSTFEHLSALEAQVALREAHRVLAPGGLLRLSVPDHEATLKLFAVTHEPILIRHLLGPQTDQFGYHMQSYCYDGLRRLVESHGFAFVNREEFKHTSPAICCMWKRA